MSFELPSRAQAGYLDPEITGEGEKVILSNGEQVQYEVAAPIAVMPDMSKIKSIAHYFNRRGHVVYPAWLYHPTAEPRLVKDAAEAGALGIYYRETTNEERVRYGGLKAVWDWKDDCEWRPVPHGPAKFDPAKITHGKNYVATPANPRDAQNALLAELVPTVAAAVAEALKKSGPAAPQGVASADWDEFLAFKAWQESQKAVNAVETEIAKSGEDAGDQASLLSGDGNALSGGGEVDRGGKRRGRAA